MGILHNEIVFKDCHGLSITSSILTISCVMCWLRLLATQQPILATLLSHFPAMFTKVILFIAAANRAKTEQPFCRLTDPLPCFKEIKVLLVLQSGQHPCFDIGLPRQSILYIINGYKIACIWNSKYNVHVCMIQTNADVKFQKLIVFVSC